VILALASLAWVAFNVYLLVLMAKVLRAALKFLRRENNRAEATSGSDASKARISA